MPRIVRLQPIKALICQILALLCVLALAGRLARFGLSPGWIIGVQGLLAALLSRGFGQPVWWLPIHLSFLPAAWLLVQHPLPAWLYPMALLLSLLVFWGTFKGEVPLFLSSTKVAEVLSVIVETEQADSLIDLGAGLGSVVTPLARMNPRLKITAVENAPLPWLILAWRCRHLPNVTVIRNNFWQCGLADYAIVFAFLSPAVMRRLGEKCRREMPKGSLLLSSSFPVPAWTADEIIELSDSRATLLYCYRLSATGCLLD